MQRRVLTPGFALRASPKSVFFALAVVAVEWLAAAGVMEVVAVAA
jgi:hypothetical protein